MVFTPGRSRRRPGPRPRGGRGLCRHAAERPPRAHFSLCAPGRQTRDVEKPMALDGQGTRADGRGVPGPATPRSSADHRRATAAVLGSNGCWAGDAIGEDPGVHHLAVPAGTSCRSGYRRPGASTRQSRGKGCSSIGVAHVGSGGLRPRLIAAKATGCRRHQGGHDAAEDLVSVEVRVGERARGERPLVLHGARRRRSHGDHRVNAAASRMATFDDRPILLHAGAAETYDDPGPRARAAAAHPRP